MWSIRILPCVVLACSAVSAAVPRVTVQPQDLTVHVGDSAVFEVGASGADTIRWFRDGAALPNAFGSRLLLGRVGLSDEGARFTCLLIGTNGNQYCRDAVLRVLRPTRQLLTLSGEMSDRFGHLIGADGPQFQDMVIEVFGSPEGGDTLYVESFLSSENRAITVEEGRFLARLGTGRLLKGDLETLARERQSLYVQFSIGNREAREVLKPRIPVTSMPYAFSGNPGILRGRGQPGAIGLEAPAGTLYVNSDDGKTWIRTFRNWVLAE